MDTEPTLTDEELAELVRGHWRYEILGGSAVCQRDSHFWPCPTVRLIAAIRAEREYLPDYVNVGKAYGLHDLLACKTCGAVVVPMYQSRHDESHGGAL